MRFTMKRTLLSITLLFASATLFGMDDRSRASSSSSASNEYRPAPVETYPTSMGYISEEELATLCAKPLPEELRDQVEALLRAHPRIADLCSLRKQHAARFSEPDIPSSLSAHNFVFATTMEEEEEPLSSGVVKIAGFGNALRSSISALGYDPYHMDKPQDTAFHACASQTRRFQHLSTLVTEELLRRAASGVVVPVQTWAYHLPDHPNTVCDQNYIVVQRRLPTKYKQFSTLSDREKRQVFNGLNLREFYRVLKFANLWNPSEENLWVNSDRQTELAYPDGEKPNNEGSGQQARFHLAIFGQSLSKARHNIRCGHDAIKSILQKYLPDRVAEWTSFYEHDPEVK